jgi:hypothetical protein
MPDLETKPRKPEPSPTRRILDLLAEEGYRPHLQEGDGPWRRIEFKREGFLYLVRVCDDDPDFVQVCLGFLLDDPIPDVATILRAGHDVQAAAKVAKFFVDPECTCYELQAELFLGDQPLGARQLERCLLVLRRAASDFSERLRTDAPRALA